MAIEGRVWASLLYTRQWNASYAALLSIWGLRREIDHTFRP
jgi:hypothetical protein